MQGLFDMILTSIPFSDQYEYSANYNDMGHVNNNMHFWQQMDYLTPNLLKVLKPGRICAVHIKDRIRYGHQTSHGFMAIERTSDQLGDHLEKHGFIPYGRITIVTDVVRENNGTYRLSWTENSNDSSKMGVGLPEYIILARKPPTSNDDQRADEPVTKLKPDHFVCMNCEFRINKLDKLEQMDNEYMCPICERYSQFRACEDYELGYSKARWQIDAHSLWRSSGNRLLLENETKLYYDYEEHVRRNEEKEGHGNLPGDYFLDPPVSFNQEYVWDTINFMQGLNSKQRLKRLINHTCPLPFDIVNRLIRRFTNEGDIILEPFAGLFTVPYCAIKLNRRTYGIELADQYYADGLKYLEEADFAMRQPTLFDLAEFEGVSIK